ncbi:IS3 family transposase, partial [Salmonella enterica subsp. enterica serovar Oranienburg]|nr:IS3 family transposase [Salmonella enterica subsp. enterica serovar Oranienburg]
MALTILPNLHHVPKLYLYALGVLSSYSRPRVSNDNPYSESLFRTLKYCPWWPENGFRTIDD